MDTSSFVLIDGNKPARIPQGFGFPFKCLLKMTAIPTTILREGMFANANRPAHNIRMGAPEMLMREMQYLFLISWFVNTATLLSCSTAEPCVRCDETSTCCTSAPGN